MSVLLYECTRSKQGRVTGGVPKQWYPKLNNYELDPLKQSNSLPLFAESSSQRKSGACFVGLWWRLEFFWRYYFGCPTIIVWITINYWRNQESSEPIGCFHKWWYPQNTPKWSFLVGKPMVVGYHHFRNPRMILIITTKQLHGFLSWSLVNDH